MTDDEKKAWLNRPFTLFKNFKNLEEELQRINDLRAKCMSISTCSENSGASFTHGENRTESKLVNLTEAERAYTAHVQRQIDEYYRVKDEVKNAIDGLTSPLERAVLTARFLNFKKIREIMAEQNYSKAHIIRALDSGVKHVEIFLAEDDTK